MRRSLALDIRKYYDFGIGTYLQQIASGVLSNDRSNLNFVLLLDNHQNQPFKETPGIKFHRIRKGRRNPIQGSVNVPGINAYHFPHYLAPIPQNKIPFILTVHDLIHLNPPAIPSNAGTYLKEPCWFVDRMKRSYHLRLSRALLTSRIAKAAKIIAVSGTTADEILNFHLCEPSKITVIYNCIDAVHWEFYDSPDIANCLGKYNLKNCQYFLYTGNDLFHKNIPFMLKSFSDFKKTTQSEIILVLAGPRNQSAIEHMAEKLGIQKWIQLLPRILPRELAMIYRSALCLISPSLNEGFGLSVVEAMAAGVPVVCADIPVYHEISGNEAIFFDPHRTDDLTDKLTGVISNRFDSATVTQRARQIAARYTSENFGEKHLELYQEVTGD